MKVLVIDDNPSLRAVLKDILSEEGHNVRLARTIDEAVFKTQSFEPDVVVLDSVVGSEDGLLYLGRLAEDLPRLRPAVVYLKSHVEIVPGDNPYVKASIDKPFRTEDIVSAVKDAADGMRAQEPQGLRQRAERRLVRRRRVRQNAPDGDAMESHGVRFGTSYAVFTRDPEDIYRFIGLVDPTRYDLMVVTTDRAKAVEERFSYGTMEVVPLSSNGKAGSLGIREIGTMTERIKEFIDSKTRPVVVIDGFDDIIAANGINQPLMMIQQIVGSRSKECTLALSVDGAVLTEKDRSIILHSMSEYITEE